MLSYSSKLSEKKHGAVRREKWDGKYTYSAGGDHGFEKDAAYLQVGESCLDFKLSCVDQLDVTYE